MAGAFFQFSLPSDETAVEEKKHIENNKTIRERCKIWLHANVIYLFPYLAESIERGMQSKQSLSFDFDCFAFRLSRVANILHSKNDTVILKKCSTSGGFLVFQRHLFK